MGTQDALREFGAPYIEFQDVPYMGSQEAPLKGTQCAMRELRSPYIETQDTPYIGSQDAMRDLGAQ